MTIPLTIPIRREVQIDGEAYTVVINAGGVRIVRKRFRAGRALTWRALLERGDDELDGATDASRAR